MFGFNHEKNNELSNFCDAIVYNTFIITFLSTVVPTSLHYVIQGWETLANPCADRAENED